MRRTFAIGALTLFLSACGNNASNPTLQSTPIEANYASIQSQILIPRCLTCHTGTNSVSKVDLSTYANLLMNDIVVPGNPQQSKLYLSINSGTMPQGSTKLPNNQIQAVYDWIQEGAEAR